ncbi:unnamed protein product [Acanthosepion pharaonis]|uniref:Uncharacterized protein n=1 Tax=Acanthosepion pharaonis TaxID=158019 RepID=A0A812CFD4_ACAPH|nr:unnamed protein product [Sepia pharaonis]
MGPKLTPFFPKEYNPRPAIFNTPVNQPKPARGKFNKTPTRKHPKLSPQGKKQPAKIKNGTFFPKTTRTEKNKRNQTPLSSLTHFSARKPQPKTFTRGKTPTNRGPFGPKTQPNPGPHRAPSGEPKKRGPKFKKQGPPQRPSKPRFPRAKHPRPPAPGPTLKTTPPGFGTGPRAECQIEKIFNGFPQGQRFFPLALPQPPP